MLLTVFELVHFEQYFVTHPTEATRIYYHNPSNTVVITGQINRTVCANM